MLRVASCLMLACTVLLFNNALVTASSEQPAAIVIESPVGRIAWVYPATTDNPNQSVALYRLNQTGGSDDVGLETNHDFVVGRHLRVAQTASIAELHLGSSASSKVDVMQTLLSLQAQLNQQADRVTVVTEELRQTREEASANATALLKLHLRVGALEALVQSQSTQLQQHKQETSELRQQIIYNITRSTQTAADSTEEVNTALSQEISELRQHTIYNISQSTRTAADSMEEVNTTLHKEIDFLIASTHNYTVPSSGSELDLERAYNSVPTTCTSDYVIIIPDSFRTSSSGVRILGHPCDHRITIKGGPWECRVSHEPCLYIANAHGLTLQQLQLARVVVAGTSPVVRMEQPGTIIRLLDVKLVGNGWTSGPSLQVDNGATLTGQNVRIESKDASAIACMRGSRVVLDHATLACTNFYGCDGQAVEAGAQSLLHLHSSSLSGYHKGISVESGVGGASYSTIVGPVGAFAGTVGHQLRNGATGSTLDSTVKQFETGVSVDGGSFTHKGTVQECTSLTRVNAIGCIDGVCNSTEDVVFHVASTGDITFTTGTMVTTSEVPWVKVACWRLGAVGSCNVEANFHSGTMLTFVQSGGFLDASVGAFTVPRAAFPFLDGATKLGPAFGFSCSLLLPGSGGNNQHTMGSAGGCYLYASTVGCTCTFPKEELATRRATWYGDGRNYACAAPTGETECIETSKGNRFRLFDSFFVQFQ